MLVEAFQEKLTVFFRTRLGTLVSLSLLSLSLGRMTTICIDSIEKSLATTSCGGDAPHDRTWLIRSPWMAIVTYSDHVRARSPGKRAPFHLIERATFSIP